MRELNEQELESILGGFGHSHVVNSNDNNNNRTYTISQSADLSVSSHAGKLVLSSVGVNNYAGQSASISVS